MRGELDWIVMKALEKDRNRRYETANGLAADLRRYLDDEPVQACPPSAWYRFRKFARRNKAAPRPLLAVVLLAPDRGTAVAHLAGDSRDACRRAGPNPVAGGVKAQRRHLAQLRLTEAAEDQAMHRLYDSPIGPGQGGEPQPAGRAAVRQLRTPWRKHSRSPET